VAGIQERLRERRLVRFDLLVEQMKFLAGLEPDSLARRDADFSTGTGIAANARLARFYGKDAEATKLDSVPRDEALLHGVKDGVYRCFRLDLWKASSVYDPLDEILLDQEKAFLALL
jgi:hypothetical protein